jgi:hypothetical protein
MIPGEEARHGRMDGGEAAHSAGHSHAELNCFVPGTEPAVFAAVAEVSLAPAVTGGQLTAAVDSFVLALVDQLMAAGCVLVGHIKGALESAAGRRLMFSVISATEAPHWSGNLCEPVPKLRVTLNVIVFGVTDQEVQDAVFRCWSAQVNASTQWQR